MLTTTKLDQQRIAHGALTDILAKEPWVLPDPNHESPTPVPTPRVTDLRKTMSERAIAKHLGISRRQVDKLITAEAQADTQCPNPFAAETLDALPRAKAIKLIAEKACRPQGAKWADYKKIIPALYGFTEDGQRTYTDQQIKDLRKAVKKKYPTATFVPDWMDASRAESQRRAVIEKMIDLSHRFTEAFIQLAQEFPGGNPKALQDQMLDLIDYRNPIAAKSWEGPYADLAGQLVNRLGDAGPVTMKADASTPADPSLDFLCA